MNFLLSTHNKEGAHTPVPPFLKGRLGGIKGGRD